MNNLQKTHAVQAATMFVCLLSVSNADAEIRTITATGEYRMSSHDTPADGKRLALLDAKRMALEQAGTYVESITQVKNFDLAKEEIRAYTAGIVEVVELATRTAVEGNTPIVRVDVKVKIDTDLVARQIEALRLDENAKEELRWLRTERTRLIGELDTQTRELSALKSDADIAKVRTQRQELVSNIEANDLFTRATGVFKTSVRMPTSLPGNLRVTPAGLRTTRELIDKGLALDPLHPTGHVLLGGIFLFVEQNYSAAIRELRTVLRVAADYGLEEDMIGSVHLRLADALAKNGDQAAAIEEYRTAMRLSPTNPQPHLGLAVTLMKMKGMKEQEAHELREYLRLTPDSSNAVENAVKEQVRARLRILQQ